MDSSRGVTKRARRLGQRRDSAPSYRRAAGAGALELPDDVLSRVLSFLEPVPELCMAACVNRQWRQLALAPSLWARVRATDALSRRREAEMADRKYQYIVYNEDFCREVASWGAKRAFATKKKRKAVKVRRGVGSAIEVITRRANSELRALDLVNCYPMDESVAKQMRDEDLSLIASRCPGVEELSLSPSALISGDALLAFVGQCKQLKKLHMTRCSITMGLLQAIVSHATLLEDVSVSGSNVFRGEGLYNAIEPIAASVKKLNVSNTPLNRLPLERMMFKCPNLQELIADNCMYMQVSGQPPRDGRSLFPSLTSLNLDKIAAMPLTWISEICLTCPNLDMLSANAAGSQSLNIDFLFYGPLPPLQHLGLSGQPLEDDMWQCIFDQLGPSLVQCDVSRNSRLTCMFEPGARKFEKLEELSLQGTAVTDAAAMMVIRTAPHLKFLDLGTCRSIANRDFRRDPLKYVCSVGDVTTLNSY